MASRNRDLRPDPQGRYRPYLGWKAGGDGKKRQHRFNLGTDKREAERRFAKIRELYDENCLVNGEDLWSPLALSYAEEIARGERRITYFPPPPALCIEDPVTDYAQMLQVDRDRFPSLDLVPADPDLYAESVRRTQGMVKGRMRDLEAELKELGAIGSEGVAARGADPRLPARGPRPTTRSRSAAITCGPARRTWPPTAACGWHGSSGSGRPTTTSRSTPSTTTPARRWPPTGGADRPASEGRPAGTTPATTSAS